MPTVRMYSDELDLTSDFRSAGAALGDELRDRVAPSDPLEYVKNLLGRRGEAGKIAEIVARGGGEGVPKRTSVQRTLERYATGERAKAGIGARQAQTLEAYQARYELNTGHRSEVLDTLINIGRGKLQPLTLPKGHITIRVMAAIDPYAGSHDPRAEEPRAVAMDIPEARNGRALLDPMAEWLREFEARLPDILINDVVWIEMSFTARNE